MPPPRLPRELTDLIIGFMSSSADDRTKELGNCALVCHGAATRLNALLSSPKCTLALFVRKFTFLRNTDATATDGGRGWVGLPRLADTMPHVGQLRQLRELAVGELPFTLLPAFPHLETLRLFDVVAGMGLLRLGKCAPRLKHLVFDHVYALRYPDTGVDPRAQTKTLLTNLRSITVRGSSVAFLVWLALIAPPAARLSLLDIVDFVPDDISFLVKYLRAGQPPERVRLALKDGYVVYPDVQWDSLASALGDRTQLDVGLWHDSVDDDSSIGEQTTVLLNAFSTLAGSKMLNISENIP
ncbi:ANK-REP-REGION domain-containing protein [Mycena kentingensis (nom. inval.)]|nr:ANK-REP-REGION domain-containing protein [Mycena kentingensis (nom. inval.)]